jgi:hypothetical protein
MSAIASFYVVPSERLPEIVAAATPEKASWFRRSEDRFRATLHNLGRELDAFDWSGWAFNMLDLYLRDAHGIVYDGFGNTLAGTQMSEARGSYWLVLPGPSAAALRMALDMIEPDRADLLALIVSEHGPDEAEEEAEAAQAAFVRFKGWLAEVTSTEVGLLSIG